VELKYPYYWRIHKWLPERYGQYCRELSRGSMNSCLLEFEDGYKVITNRWYRRKRKAVKKQQEKQLKMF